MAGSGITRRDFLNGMALPLAAGVGTAASAAPAERYPPAATGLRGSHPGSFEVAHALARDGARWPRPAHQTDGHYDLVVVGAGISGLAAAYLFRAQAGPAARILILDNHDDFGGHAKRNEFSVGGRTLLGYGGSQSIDSPAGYSRVAAGLLREIGVRTQRFYEHFDTGFAGRHGLERGVLFGAPSFASPRLVADHRYAADAKGSAGRLRDYPVSGPTRLALERLAAGAFNDTDAVRKAFAGATGTPVEAFLGAALDMPADGLELLRDMPLGLWGFGLDGLSLQEIVDYESLGSGLNAAAARFGVTPRGFAGHDEEPYIFHFPDGNASIARLLVRSLIPGALPGGDMDDAVLARADYGRLDRSENTVRIRLDSTAVDARNVDGGAEVTYLRDGTVERVAAAHVILACYNNIVPFLCPELGAAQRAALDYPEKIPLVVVNVALRNWRAIADSGIGQVYTPGGFLVSMGLDFPVSMGGYRFSPDPDQPVVLHCWHAGIDRDRSRHLFERLKRGRQQMLARPFAGYESAVRQQLTAAWGGHGLDPDRDIAALTVNRWPHGYAWEYTDLWDDPAWRRGAGPHVVGRQQLGRISIANSDAEALAYVNGAIDAAYRAVHEQTTW